MDQTVTSGTFARLKAGCRVLGMRSAASGKQFLCMQCEMTEEKCACEKYCAFCQSQIDVRLSEDGLFYCAPCREACGYKTADE